MLELVVYVLESILVRRIFDEGSSSFGYSASLAG